MVSKELKMVFRRLKTAFKNLFKRRKVLLVSSLPKVIIKEREPLKNELALG